MLCMGRSTPCDLNSLPAFVVWECFSSVLCVNQSVCGFFFSCSLCVLCLGHQSRDWTWSGCTSWRLSRENRLQPWASSVTPVLPVNIPPELCRPDIKSYALETREKRHRRLRKLPALPTVLLSDVQSIRNGSATERVGRSIPTAPDTDGGGGVSFYINQRYCNTVVVRERISTPDIELLTDLTPAFLLASWMSTPVFHNRLHSSMR